MVELFVVAVAVAAAAARDVGIPLEKTSSLKMRRLELPERATLAIVANLAGSRTLLTP